MTSADRIRTGDTRALARAATLIENREPTGLALLRELAEHTGNALVVGVTGPPGAGKSTLIGALTRVLRAQGQRVAILAVDPSSSLTGGALLGDRIRMRDLHDDAGVFIRSMATRGRMGGIAAATSDLAILLDAADFSTIFIETVGVGQDEIEISRVADVTAVVLIPGLGDDVQAIKAGLLEIADFYVLNKADQPGIEQLERDLREASDSPAVRLRSVASEGQGIEQILTALDGFRSTRRERLPSLALAHLDHIAIAVQSIDESLKFYRDQLGLNVSLRETVTREKVRVAMLPAGGSRLELLEPVAPDTAVGRFLAKRGEGLHHVALRVPDLPATLLRLRDAGAKLIGKPQRGAGGHRYVFVHPASTGGVLLELIQEEKHA